MRRRMVCVPAKVFCVAIVLLSLGCESERPTAGEAQMLKITVGEPTALTPAGTSDSASLSVSRTGVVAALYPTPQGPRYRISKDKGLNWSDEMTLPVYMAHGAGLRDGGVIHFTNRRFIAENELIEVDRYIFTDDFLHYEVDKATVILPSPTDEVVSGVMFFAPTFDNGKILELPNGDLLALMYGYVKGDIGTRVMIIKSTDKGRAWQYRATVASYDGDPNPELPGEFPGYSENSLTLLPNGQLLVMMRTQGAHFPPDFRPMSASWSNDLGQTWTKPVPTKPHLMNIWPMLATLENGVVACLYGRPGIHVAFSTDNGHTWGNRISFLPTPDPEQGEIVKVGPNKLVALACMGVNGIRAYPITVELVKDPTPGPFELAGRVLDEEGNPVAGAVVERGPNRYTSEYQPIQAERGYPTVQTDAEGRFRFEGVKRGETVLTVEAEGYAPSLRHVRAEPGMEPVEFKLKPGRVISGRVVDEIGVPVVGACVFINDWHGHTDSCGEYKWVVRGAVPATAKVRIVKRYYTQQSRTLSLSDIQQPMAIHRLPYPGDGPEILCARVETAPAIDAEFDDELWSRSPVASEFWLRSAWGARNIPVKARFAYDNKRVYAIMRVGAAKGASLSEEDMLELYIAKNMDRRSGCQFAYNLEGRLPGFFIWNCPYTEYHVRREPDGGWTVSTSIRWILIGVGEPQPGAALSIGIAHVQGGRGQSASPSLPKAGPPTVFRCGRLVLE